MAKRKKSKNTKKRSIKHKINNMKTHKKTRKILGGIQKIYVSVQPSALGIREAREWKKYDDGIANRHNVPKLLSKVTIENETGFDVDERIAEIIESIKGSDKLLSPIHGKLLTTTIT